MFFRDRSRVPELMDDHGGDRERLFRTFDQIGLINELVGGNRFFIPLLSGDMARQGRHDFTVVDVGSGGGDFALHLSRVLQRRSIRARICCIDNDPRAVDYARKRCAGRPDIVILNADFRKLATFSDTADYVFSNHLLHHLTDTEATELVRAVGQTARLGWIVSDLKRSVFWYGLFAVLAAAFLHGSYARCDGLRSIRKSFKKKELGEIALQAGISPPPCIWEFFPGGLALASDCFGKGRRRGR